MMIVLPIRTVSGLNVREHWAKRAKRVKNERLMAYLMMPKVEVPCTILLTRCGPRKMDDDNLRGACKAVRDGISEKLGIDDGSDAVRWEYAQEKSKVYGVRVEVL